MDYSRGGAGIGSVGGDYVSQLPEVTDPDKTYASITRNDYMDYVSQYRGFEEDLLDRAQNDTSLIDDARVNAKEAQGLMAGVANRNANRYGVSLTPAQQQEQSRGLARANNLGAAQSVNDARIAQKDLNQAAIGDLINIGQGVNRSSLGQMQGAAQSATQRKNAYDSAKAASKAQTYSAVGGLASAAIFAFAF
tara:strand:- start:600 stop:1178 length:579 start_codon:yes stop_codon:yes gene_type:complete